MRADQMRRAQQAMSSEHNLQINDLERKLAKLHVEATTGLLDEAPATDLQEDGRDQTSVLQAMPHQVAEQERTMAKGCPGIFRTPMHSGVVAPATNSLKEMIPQSSLSASPCPIPSGAGIVAQPAPGDVNLSSSISRMPGHVAAQSCVARGSSPLMGGCHSAQFPGSLIVQSTNISRGSMTVQQPLHSPPSAPSLHPVQSMETAMQPNGMPPN